MKKIKRNQFNEEQLRIVDNMSAYDLLINSLFELEDNKELSLKDKRCFMLRELGNFIRVRKNEFLLVGIKSQIADKLVFNELKTLSLSIKELKDVFSKDC